MKNEEVASVVRYRLEQADAALGDAKFLLDGNRSPQGIVNRSYYAMFYAALALLRCSHHRLSSSERCRILRSWREPSKSLSQ